MTRTTAQSLSATDVSTSATLLELLPRFHRPPAAENKAAKTITAYTEAVNRLNECLTTQGMPTRLASITAEHLGPSR